MVDYVSRAEWGARASRGGTSLSEDAVLNVALHWPGSAKPINAIGAAGFARVCSALRGWQAYHMDGRGWSDIAYQIAVDQAGRAYTLRGINIKSGANGDGTVNAKYGAILLILGPGEQPSAAMLATTKAVLADFRKRFRRIPKRPTTHSRVRPAGTSCPGPAAISAVDAGKFDAGTVTTPPPPPTPAPEESMSAADVQNLKNWFEHDYMPRLYDAAKNGTAGKYQQALMRRLDAIGVAVSGVDEAVWGAQVTKLTTEDPNDKEALSSVATYGPDRAAQKMMEALEPRLAAIEAKLGITSDDADQ